MTYEQLVDRFPGLIKGLVDHPWIGFVLVRSAAEGGLVIGKDGVYYLDHGYAAGVDPLTPYGPNAARHLKREDGFPNCPDLLVMSGFDPATGEVAAFEELIGCHGGLGGPQTRPFVLHPTAFDPGDEAIVGAAALHRVLKRWVTVTKPVGEPERMSVGRPAARIAGAAPTLASPSTNGRGPSP
jgi:hypothetical protein